MAVREFALPDLGEGLTESELVAWKVAVGDTVQLNQIIAEVETAKALVELPAPYDGRVARLFVEPGVTVAVGEPLVAFEVDAGEAAADAPVAPAAPDAAGAPAPSAGGLSADGREPTLVGYGARPESGARPARRARPGLAATAPAPVTPAAAAPAPSTTATALAERPRATPPVRKFARELGVDLASVAGSGDRGLITRGDVQLYVDQHTTDSAGPTVEAGSREKRIPIRGVRKATADAMVRSAFGAPQATVFLTVDVTPTMELIARLRERAEQTEARPGLLSVVAKALLLAVRRTPEVNSRWDDAANEIVEAEYVHLGIAAATPRGLMVPVIRDADRMTLGDLSGAIRSLAETARAGRTAPADLSGGTITITNVGVFGVDAGTPILTPGEAAILAVGAVRRQPWEHDGGIALRQVLTLALTFDHRIVDGEQASRFLADIGRILADPASVLTLV
ncbi:dihydrolipoamide acetyltransferase family protein [Leifsonia sp. 21MFCrub1.1]|uniref:dihydrolipoamide acetyltransferase family protein n=1 Tax=Leifsonia sp. 21MFCrub1.1 TaxID=1798223 RepID=UPI0008928532|nr:dihydrolipoamide acetyltransferase family protein [Leifsonia sp. 21MFCrub1.1]SEA93730.1 pyruvate dehydrogenase E2 component (dihydrolipoamide acetyltransferase) [Leifsonia sp. 21MFCrub1.1]